MTTKTLVKLFAAIELATGIAEYKLIVLGIRERVYSWGCWELYALLASESDDSPTS